MPIFHYQAFDATGALHKGTQDAANESEVRQLLRSKDLFPKEIRTSRFTRKSNKAKTSEGFKLPEFAKRRNYAKSLMLFTRQLEVLLDATIPYDKAFQLIIPQTEDHSFQSILSEIRGRLLEGESLANSMEKHPEAFPAMYISMVRSGENGGNLGMIMKRLADYYERQDRLRSQIRSAMIYPAFMTVFEDTGDLGNDVGDHEDHHCESENRHECRIDHRRPDLRAKPVLSFIVVGQSFHDHAEVAAVFSGADHADVHCGKSLGVFFHRIRQRLPFQQAPADVREDALEGMILSLGDDQLESLVIGNGGIQQHLELTRKKHQRLRVVASFCKFREFETFRGFGFV